MATVSYKKLWKLLIDKNMKKKDLEAAANISNYTVGKLNQGKNVNVDINITKKRLLLLLKLLYSQTDEQHPISTVDLLSYFDTLDMKPDRKTLKADIDLIYEMGVNVVTVPGNPVQYFVADRGFELPEIKLLIDAVQSSRFITAKKSKALTNKLVTRLASTQQAKELARTLYTANRVKPVNEQIYVHVDHIFTAINGHLIQQLETAEPRLF